jgi:DNA polymerase (family 10)
MAVHNSDIAEVFDQVADILEIEGSNPFRVRAYRNAARVVGNWPSDLAGLIGQGETLPKLPGIGKDLAGKIAEIAQTGHLKQLDVLKKEVPESLVDLMRIPGLGPKRVRLLQERLQVRSRRDLERVVRSGKLKSLPGFGTILETKIQGVLEKKPEQQRRMKLAVVEQAAESLLRFLRELKGVARAEAAGSFRRRVETVGDLDLLVTLKRNSNGAANVMDRFVKYEDVTSVVAFGETKSTVILRSGLQVDLRVVPEESFGAALYYFTGSKAHNIAVRTLALKRKLKINEYGIFRGKKRIAGRTENEVFASVGLRYTEPELRENRGEIEAARTGTLPKLVTREDIRGDLHAHTNETDGRATLSEMAESAMRLGYEYLAITEHSRRLTVAKGLTPARLKAQIRKIDKLNEELAAGSRKFRILKGIEVDILEDGSLDLPDDVLELLDLTVCSIHSKFELSEERQTERIIRAMDNPHFNILGHPTGRLIGLRDPYSVNIERIVQAARDRDCFLEVNAQPDRMDLADNYCHLARNIGVRVAISTDSHSVNDLANMRFGVSQARRGWLERDDVLNTRSAHQLLKLL